MNNPPRGNRTNHSHKNSNPCPEGCKCGRHSRSGRPKVVKGQCIITDADGRCENVGYTSDNVCKKHQVRLIRTGTYERRNRKRAKPTPVGPTVYCLCSHKAEAHKLSRNSKDREECQQAGCNCLMFSKTEPVFLRRRLTQIKSLGFLSVLNDTALCDRCGENIKLGFWHDPIVLRRGLIHRRQTCKAIKAGRSGRQSA